MVLHFKEAVKREEFQYRVTVPIVIGMSYTEKVILKINTLCFSVAPYLSVKNTFESASFYLESGLKIWVRSVF